MSDFELSVYLVDAFGLDPGEAREAIQLYRERKGKVTAFTLHDKFEWAPDVCQRVRDYLAERLAA